MALVIADRVKETTTTTGTGPVTLGGAATGYQSFAAVGNGNTTYYTIADQTGANWEVGIGTYTASGTTLSRDTVLASSNAGALVPFGAGTKDVFVTYPADYADTAQVGDVVLATNQPNGPGTWLETGKYYSKAAYPALASAVGDVPDIGNVVANSQAQVPASFGVPAATGFPYVTATDGTTTVAVGTNGAIRKTTDGVNWVPVLSGVNGNLNSVVYINSNFVTVGANGALVTSSDGTNWTPRITPSTATLTSAAFGNTRYVAVGASGNIVYSTDLVTWTLATGTGTNQFNKVVYANSIFVAVGATGTIYTSTDGITWANRTIAGASGFNDVVYANSVFVAITASGTPWYSSDGINWTSNYAQFATNTSTINPYITATDNTTTVVVGASGAIYKSTNGSTWIPVASGTAQTLNAAAYVNSNFVAVGASGTITTSSDGTTWTVRNSGTTNALNSVAFGNTRYVAVGASGTIVYSTNLTGWTTATGTGTAAFNRVIYANSTFVAVGASGAVYTSTDGITWVNRTFQTTAFNDVTYAASNFVAITSTGTPWYSADGIAWSSRYASFAPTNSGLMYFTATDGTTTVLVGASGAIYQTTNGSDWYAASSSTANTLNSVSYVNGNFVAVGNTGTLVSSSNGLAWTARTSGVAVTLFSVAFGNTRYVAVGASGTIISSTDLVNWSTATGTGSSQFLKIIYANSLFVAVGAAGAVYTSTDGITWTSRSAGAVQFNDVIYANSLFVAVGLNGNCYTSPDGTTWTSRSAGANTFYQVLYANSLFITVGVSNSIYTSADGITWTARTSPFAASTGIANSAVCWNGTNFVVVTNTAGKWLSSADGITWTGNVDISLNAFRSVAVVSSKTIGFGDSAVVILAGATRAVVLQSNIWAYTVSSSLPNPRSIAYNGSSQYVAVGSNGVVMASSDGQSWTAYNTGLITNFNNVQYLNGNYIAGGPSGSGTNLLTSPDGTTWTSRTAGTGFFSASAFGASVYVVVGGSGVVFSSPDLATWTSRSAGASTFNDVVFANSVFVAVGVAGTCYSSTDGITWTSRSAGSTQFNRVVYANSLFLAVGNTGTIYTSPDGTTWTVRTSGTTQNLNDAVWNGSFFCVVGANGTILTSPDGVTWTIRPTGGFIGLLNSVSWSGSRFVITSDSNSVLTSDNGVNWQLVGTQFSGANSFLYNTYAGGKFIAVGTSRIATSTDGIRWTAADPVQFTALPGLQAASNVTYGNSKFVISGTGNINNIATSTDGITWTPQLVGTFTTSTNTQAWYYCLWNGSAYYLVGERGRYATSSDATTWTLVQDASVSNFYSVVVANSITTVFGDTASVILAGASRAVVLFNSNWAYTVTPSSAPNPRTVAYNGSNQYVAVGSNGVILSSTDGQAWTGRYAGIVGLANFDKVQYLNGNYIVMGQSNQVSLITSSDGITWTPRPAPGIVLNAAAYGAGVYVAVGISGAVISSPDLATWTSRSAGSNAFNDVIFANSVFVAVGASNAVYSSTDGTTWTLRTATGTFNRIIYANSLFVAVGNSGVIFTSSDGTTWNSRTSNVASNLNDVVWNGSIFCAVGASGVITTSSDGITWTARTSNGTNALTSISWDGTRFVVTNTTNSSVLVSTDGIVWTSYITQFSGNFLYSTYAGGKFIAVGSTQIATSTNGISWTAADPVQFTALPGFSSAYTVTYSNSLFVISGLAGSTANIATSTDGITWTARFVGNFPTAASQNWHYCLWNGSAYYLIGANGRYATSSDAVTWTVTQDVSAATFYSVAVVNGKTIAFGNASSVLLAGATRTEVFQLAFWSYAVSATSASNPRTIAYNGTNQYVAVGSNGVFLSSTDGQTWTGRYSGVVNNFDKVQYLNGNYLAMGGNNALTNLVTSPDGTTWTPQNAGAVIYNAAAYGAGVYVVVGVSGAVFSSPDLVTWTSRSAGANTFNDVVFANSLFVAVGASNSIYTSPNGVTWTLRTATGTFNRVIYANSLFVALASNGAIVTSPDGITWTSRTSGVGGSLNDVVWNGSIFCAVGANGGITTSSNGTTWTARTPGDSAPTLLSVSWSGTRFVVTNSTNGVAWVSTDGITWTRASTVYRGNTLYSAYLGGEFLAIGSQFIQTSTDGLNWTNCDHVQYVPSSVSRVYKFGAYYYALTSNGIFQSSDGITFTLASRSIPSTTVLAMAYSGSVWLAVVTAGLGQPQAFYRSTDGITWSKSAEFGVLTSNPSVTTASDLVYANGNFISGQSIVGSQNILGGAYTSSDGITWTSRALPLGASAVTTTGSSSVGTDGTTVLMPCTAVNNSFIAKSTDGGVTWTNIALLSGGVVYSGGLWWVINYVSTDATNFTATPGGFTNFQLGIYVHNNKYALGLVNGSVRIVYTKNGGSAIVYSAPSNYFYSPTAFSAAQSKEYPLRGTTLLSPNNSFSNSVAPNLIAEFPLYSYNTTTTFWVPPQSAGGGQVAYIYAGA